MSRLLRVFLKVSSLVVSVLIFCGSSLAQSWNLPVEISPANTDVRFEVDSTWHMIHGTAGRPRGRAALADPANPASVMVDLFFPVRELNTENSRRDTRMREVLAESSYPEIEVHLKTLGTGCERLYTSEGTCRAELPGVMKIRGVERPLVLDCTVERNAGGIQVSGEYTFSWADFGVEDPSIIVARLNKNVRILYTVKLPN